MRFCIPVYLPNYMHLAQISVLVTEYDKDIEP